MKRSEYWVIASCPLPQETFFQWFIVLASCHCSFVVSVLFPAVSFPMELGVSAGESAYFPCQVWSKPADGASFTIAISVWDPSLGDMRQCINCSFSATTELTECAVPVPGTERGCSGMQFLKSSYTDSTLPTQILRHNLTAYWSEVGAHRNGHKVTCAVAARRVIQWAHTATITGTHYTHTHIY